MHGLNHLPVVEITEGSAIIFGGPYSNVQATRALFDAADRLGVPQSRIICTGDVVAYCGDPAETARLTQASGVTVVAGNCEAMAAEAADDCGCGFDAGSTCAALSADWWGHISANVDAPLRRWMADLPSAVELRIGGRRLLVTHGVPGSDNTFVFPSGGRAEKLSAIAAGGLDGIVAGHSGLPFVQILDGQLWLNAGAIGMPANDGTPRGWYAVLTVLPDGLDIRLEPLAYDHQGAAGSMRQQGLAAGYASCLLTGRWPSEDVLPPQERAQAGRPLAPRRVFWPTEPIQPAGAGRLVPEAV
ncbi:MAG: metallophosphoesterase family protein [Alphaproteobacteria bacterium]